MTLEQRILAATYKGLKDERDRINVPLMHEAKQGHVDGIETQMESVALEYNGGEDNTPPPPPDDDF